MDEGARDSRSNGNTVDVNEKLYESCLVRNLEPQVIEIGHGIGFSPESNLAG
jgi:hypothetical protein